MASKLYIRAEHRNNDAYETIKSAIYQATIKDEDQSINHLSYNCVLLTRSRRMGQRGPVNPDLHESRQVRASRQLKAGNIGYSDEECDDHKDMK